MIKWLFGDMSKMQKLASEMQKIRIEISGYNTATK